jgi:hypothetical protein
VWQMACFGDHLILEGSRSACTLGGRNMETPFPGNGEQCGVTEDLIYPFASCQPWAFCGQMFGRNVNAGRTVSISAESC